MTGAFSRRFHAFHWCRGSWSWILMTLLRFFSAFYVANDERAFLSLFGSMALSCWGISTGLFLSNHLAIVDLEDEDDLMLESVKQVVFDPFFPDVSPYSGPHLTLGTFSSHQNHGKSKEGGRNW